MNHRLTPKPQLATPYGSDVPALHALKLFCAFMVVLIHTEDMEKNRWLEFTRIAVPIFFMITGYFMVAPDGTIDTRRVGSTVKKLIWVILGLQALYFVRWVYSYAIPTDSLHLLFHPRLIFHLIVFGHTFGFHLWYLATAAESLIIIWIAAKWKIDRWLYQLVPLGILTGLAFGRYYPLEPREYVPFHYLHNFFVFGLPCIVIGIAMRRRRLPDWSVWTAWGIAAFALLAMMIETVYIAPGNQAGDYVALTIPAAALVFLACCKIEATPGILTRLGRNYSSGIYFYHVMVIWILGDIFANITESPWEAPVAFLISLAIAAGIEALKKRIPLRGAKRARGGLT